MSSSDTRAVTAFRRQAEICASLGSPMYGDLIGALADDLAGGGPTKDVLGPLADDGAAPPVLLALRLVGGLHRLVLDDEVPALAASYPSVGGVWDRDVAWPHVRAALVEHRERLHASLDHPLQTNEVGRSAALAGGVLRVADRFALPVRLIEIGASAGLNLRVDHYRFGSPSGWWGPVDSRVAMRGAWKGLSPPVDAPLEIVERTGFDLTPLDIGQADDRRVLEAYTWPDMTERLSRLRAATTIAQEVPVRLEQRSAADGLDALELVDGTATVVWHSITWPYLDDDEQRRIVERLDALGATADVDRVLAHVRLEPADVLAGPYPVILTTWPFGEATEIGSAPPHGLPVTWTA
ncbi:MULTISPECIES: DUF2332 domain-containing protein [Mumia]|uniref:DUF2332 domain-containing protein n=1 Tax=Mumia TaxID=1546255 RepID=UPI001423CF8E|nr:MULTISPECIES: DUF2332 domain-containing protein [unclassified Mumia]QMW67277.1 DUF2332 domain-containing protein [Mumia sp. ZJ1417]